MMTPKMYLKEQPHPFSRRIFLEVTDQMMQCPTNLFTRTETSTLVQLFNTNAKKNGVEGGLSYMEFRLFLFGTLDITDPVTLDGLTRAAAMVLVRGRWKIEKVVHLEGFLRTMCTLMRGDLESRAALAFEVMDIDSDGLLQANIEMKRLLHSCIDVENPEPGLADDPWEASRDFNRYIAAFFEITPTSPLNLAKFTEMVREKPWLLDMAIPVFPEPFSRCTFEFLFKNEWSPK